MVVPVVVSIPQSGFGAFEPWCEWRAGPVTGVFQSLSRDSGRLNHAPHAPGPGIWSRFNPSVGIRGV